jgi:hypothetical protein
LNPIPPTHVCLSQSPVDTDLLPDSHIVARIGCNDEQTAQL